MRLNSGEAFFHPVTHSLIESNSFYKGAAHLDHEDVEEVEEIEEEVKGSSKAGKGKSTASNDDEENK